MNIKQDEKRLITYYLTRLFWLHYFDYTILATPFCQLAPIKGVYLTTLFGYTFLSACAYKRCIYLVLQTDRLY